MTVCSCPSSSVVSSYRSVSSSVKIFALIQVSKAGTGAGSLLFRATTYGTLLISPSSPSSWFWWLRFRPWSHHGLLAGTYKTPCFGTILVLAVLCRSSPIPWLSLWAVRRGRVYVTTFKCFLYYFLGILGYISVDTLVYFFSNVSVFLFLQLLASTCPGFHGREGGIAGHRSVFIRQPPWLLILRGSQVRHTRSPSHLSINLLLIPKVSILSKQMKFCFS